MTQLGMQTNDQDLRLTTDERERERNDEKDRENKRGTFGEGACGLPSGILDRNFDKRRSFVFIFIDYKKKYIII